jgi:hypothetical protein
VSETGTEDWERRAKAAEARVEELSEERARLWDELHLLRAERRQIEHYEAKARYVEQSLSWKVTRPLRDSKALAHKVRTKLSERS